MTAGGKGHARRRENTALVEANWPFPDRRKTTGCSSTAEQGALTASVVGSNPTAPANCDDCQAAVYVDDATGQTVTADWWPGDKIDA